MLQRECRFRELVHLIVNLIEEVGADLHFELAVALAVELRWCRGLLQSWLLSLSGQSRNDADSWLHNV